MYSSNSLHRAIVIILSLSTASCASLRGKLSQTKWGNRTLVGYDRSVAKVKKGMTYTKKKARDLVSKADQEWLDNMIDTIGVRPALPKNLSDAAPAQVAGQLIWPVKSATGVALTSPYGWRWGRRHLGIDLGAPTGTPVYAVASGTVLFSANGHNGFGNLIIIQHPGTTSSYYAHNSKLIVKQGTRVRQGQLISLVGETGRATGPHLHFEIRHGHDSVDPCDYLPANPSFEC